MAEDTELAVSLQLLDGYRFRVDFDEPGMPSLVMDEPAPLGEGSGPDAARLLAAAIGNCLSASALFCLRKARVPVSEMKTEVRASLVRNQAGRLRVGRVAVDVKPTLAAADRERIGRCLELFEDFCVVTQSVRDGLAVSVQVLPEVPASRRPRHDPAPG
jgi:uncharacterized OsmC-like protein